MENTSIAGKSDEELYAELKDLPYFKNLPLPNHWYKKFNLPAPRPVSFQTFAMERRWLEHKFDEGVEYEVKSEPVEGGVRPIVESAPIPVEIITKNDGENQQLTLEESACSKESSDSMPLSSQAAANSPSCDA
jgi:hypothetical protein